MSVPDFNYSIKVKGCVRGGGVVFFGKYSSTTDQVPVGDEYYPKEIDNFVMGLPLNPGEG